MVAIEAARINLSRWRSLWNPLSEVDIRHLDAIIKDREKDYNSVRVEAKRIKKQPPYSEARIVLNPKIDSKTQRRLQCSLPFKTFWEKVAGKEKYESNHASLWEYSFPNPIHSPARQFKRFQSKANPDAS